ncbi:membrane dipeptidase [Bacteroidota bacterium]
MKTFRFLSCTITILLFLINLNSIAQSNIVSISGNVSDFVTEDVLTDVTIYITDINNGSIDSTLTNSFGLWEYDLTVTSIRENQQLPAQFSVSQNYPNPFNPSTKIEIFIPDDGEVKVTIFNILGEIKDTYKEYLNAGSYSIEWSARGSAGVYFFNVKTKNGSITRKMILLDGGQGKDLSGFRAGNNFSYNKNDKLSSISTSVPIKIQTSKFGYVPHEIDTIVSGDEYFNFVIETIHSHSIVADLHNDILEKMIENPNYHLGDLHNYNHTDIPRLQTGGVDVQLIVVWVNPYTHGNDSYNHAMEMVNIFNDELFVNKNTIGQACTKTEALSLIEEHKISFVMCVEGGHAIENDIGKLKSLHQAGMRYMTITWNNSLDWAVSAQDSRATTVGLTEFGKKVIRTMDTLGVIIDVSHTGAKTIEDIITVTKNPIIASHACVRSLKNHYRNLYDEQIISIANTGGIIGIVFYPPFLTNSDSADINSVVDHIDYIVNLVGIDHAALGSDFDGVGTLADGLEDVSKFPDLTLELLRRGYSQSEVEKILGGNFMRVFEQVCGE